MQFADLSPNMVSLLAPVIGVCVCGLIAFISLRLSRKPPPPPPTPLQILIEELAAECKTKQIPEGTLLGRRQAERRSDNCVAVLVSDFEARAEPFTAYVLDRSSGGLGLAMSELVQVGDVLSVRAVLPGANAPWVQVRVIYRNPLGATFARVGCQFVTPPSWSVLLFFG
jgi:hypothetical protein